MAFTLGGLKGDLMAPSSHAEYAPTLKKVLPPFAFAYVRPRLRPNQGLSQVDDLFVGERRDCDLIVKETPGWGYLYLTHNARLTVVIYPLSKDMCYSFRITEHELNTFSRHEPFDI